MPIEINQTKTPKEMISSIEESDSDIDEDAYQSDFKKKRPKKPFTTSLLSGLLSTQTQAIQIPTNTKQSSDPLSESLKRNLEWEHAQNSMKKYDKKKSLEDLTWVDDFSRW
ncbi:hypothetical protein CU098_012805 [Rhizopus stolonifer]|uniref:Uncharacterized protein n=1 Tax=Rhizopus stolonifer TaxID=4846 RepID=A0A367KN10_RHIST|nr:hypothetical protein CU098_012805 [Rhizopus stolonifer]